MWKVFILWRLMIYTCTCICEIGAWSIRMSPNWEWTHKRCKTLSRYYTNTNISNLFLNASYKDIWKEIIQILIYLSTSHCLINHWLVDNWKSLIIAESDINNHLYITNTYKEILIIKCRNGKEGQATNWLSIRSVW